MADSQGSDVDEFSKINNEQAEMLHTMGERSTSVDSVHNSSEEHCSLENISHLNQSNFDGDQATVEKINKSNETENSTTKADKDETVNQSRELKSLLALSKEARLDTNITRKRKSISQKKKIKIENRTSTGKSVRIQYPVTAESELEMELQSSESHKVEIKDEESTSKSIKRKKIDSFEDFIIDDVPKRSRKSLTCEVSKLKFFQPNKDIFCWRCHKDGVNISCETCPRSYHQRCLKQTIIDSNHWPCPECVAILKAESTQTRSAAMKDMTLEHLCSLLKFAVNRMIQCQGSEPFIHPVSIAEFPDYKKYIIQPMDLTLLEQNIKDNLYGSTQAFEADAKWILHNSIIFNSYQSKLTTVAKGIIKICKQEMAEIENCPSCYLNANTKKKTWFVEVCPKPHLLVWAKLRGFPFWPGKAMSCKDGMVDVRFFGAHDRAWVPEKECYLYTPKDPNAFRVKRADIEQCVDELNIHVENLKEIYVEFNFPPFKTPLDPDNETKQLELFLPRYRSYLAKSKIANRLSVGKDKKQQSGGDTPTETKNKIKQDHKRELKEKDDDDMMEGYGTDDETIPEINTEMRKNLLKSSDPENREIDDNNETQISTNIEAEGNNVEVGTLSKKIESNKNTNINTSSSESPIKKPSFDDNSPLQVKVILQNSESKSESPRISDKINKVDITENVEISLGNSDKASVSYSDKISSGNSDCSNDYIECKKKPIQIDMDNAEFTISPDSKLKMVEKLMKRLSDADEPNSQSSNVSKNVECVKSDLNKKESPPEPKKSVHALEMIQHVVIEPENSVSPGEPEDLVSSTDIELTQVASQNEEVLTDNSVKVTANLQEIPKQSEDAGNVTSNLEESVSEVSETEIRATNASESKINSRSSSEDKIIIVEEAKKVQDENVSNIEEKQVENEGEERIEEKTVEETNEKSKSASEGSRDLPETKGKSPIETDLKIDSGKAKKNISPPKPAVLLEEQSAEEMVTDEPVHVAEEKNTDSVNGENSMVLCHVSSPPDKENLDNPLDETSTDPITDNNSIIIIDKEKNPICDRLSEKKGEDDGIVEATNELDLNIDKAKIINIIHSSLSNSSSTESASPDKNPRHLNLTNNLPSPMESGKRKLTDDNGQTTQNKILKLVSIESIMNKANNNDNDRENRDKDGKPSLLKTSLQSKKNASNSTGTSNQNSGSELQSDDIKSEPDSEVESGSIQDLEAKKKYLSALNILEKREADAHKPKSNEIRTRSKTEEKRERFRVVDNMTKIIEDVALNYSAVHEGEILPGPKKKPHGLTIQKPDGGEIFVKSFAKIATGAPEVNRAPVSKQKARKSFPHPNYAMSATKPNTHCASSSKELSRIPTSTRSAPVGSDANNKVTSKASTATSTPISTVVATVMSQHPRPSVPPLQSIEGIRATNGYLILQPPQSESLLLLPPNQTTSYTSALASPMLSLGPCLVSAASSNIGLTQTSLWNSIQSTAPKENLNISNSQNYIPQGESDKNSKTNPVRNIPCVANSNQNNSRTESLVATSTAETATPVNSTPNVVERSSENSNPVLPDRTPPVEPETVTVTETEDVSEFNVLNSSLLPENVSKFVNEVVRRSFPKLKPRPPGILSQQFSEGAPSSAGPVTTKINSIAHRMGDYFRGMLIETLDDLGKADNAEATITSLRLEIENLKHQHSIEIAEIEKNMCTILRDVQRSIAENKEKIIEETRAACEEEAIKRVEEAKSKQWCANCSKEAQFYCCWNTSYCDYPCQQKHWPTHMNKCTQNTNQTTQIVPTSSVRPLTQQLVLRPANPPSKSGLGRVFSKPIQKVYVNRNLTAPKTMRVQTSSGNVLTMMETNPGNYQVISGNSLKRTGNSLMNNKSLNLISAPSTETCSVSPNYQQRNIQSKQVTTNHNVSLTSSVGEDSD